MTTTNKPHIQPPKQNAIILINGFNGDIEKILLNGQTIPVAINYLCLKYYFIDYKPPQITMKRSNDSESLIITCLDSNKTISIPLKPEYKTFNQRLSYQIESKVIETFNLERDFRWIADGNKNKFENRSLCGRSSIPDTKSKVILEETIKLNVVNNCNNNKDKDDDDDDDIDEILYQFPTVNFLWTAHEYADHVPSDIEIIFNNKRYNAYTTPKQIGLQENDTIYICNKVIDGRLYQNFCKTLTGKTITIDTKLLYSVFDLKYLIQQKEGIAPEEQGLIYAGKYLEDKRTLKQYMIWKECTIHLRLLLFGS